MPESNRWFDHTPTPTAEPTPTPWPEPLVLSIPVGEPQAIDGVIAPGEWDSAVVSSFLDGSEILLMHKDGYLYLAVRAKTTGLIAGNIYLAAGDQIIIMHTSAALGTAHYQLEGQTWQLTQGFVWRCRQTSNSDAAMAAREAFFEEEGWVSINGYMGTPNELEYKITLPEGEFRLAANYIGADSAADIKVPWPAYLTDGTTTPTPGGPPQQMQFVPEVWAAVELISN